jgi:hypothetical protein
LKQVEITHHKMPETEDMIKKRIRAGEQVMVFTPSSDPEESHIFHAGLDKRGHIISFSDLKPSKKRYQRVNLSHGTYVTFSVLPQGTAPISINHKSTDFELAA